MLKYWWAGEYSVLRVLFGSQTVQYTTEYVLIDIFCLQASIRAFKSTSLSPGSSPSSLSRSVSVIFLLHRFHNYENFNWFCVSFTPMCCCELMIIYSSYSAMTSFYANAHSSRCIFPVSMAYIPPRCRFPVSMAYFSQVYVPCVMTVSVSWMSFWLDHKAVRKGCLDLILITSTLVPENVSGCPILSKTSYCAGARQSCPRGHHSAGNVHNSGFDILQKENAFHLTYQQSHTQVIKHILQKKNWFLSHGSAIKIPILPPGQHPKLIAPGGLHESHRRVVRGVCLLCLQCSSGVCSCQLRFQVGRYNQPICQIQISKFFNFQRTSLKIFSLFLNPNAESQ